jgi:hypothetical protein
MFDFETFYNNHNKLSSFKFKYSYYLFWLTDITKNEVKKIVSIPIEEKQDNILILMVVIWFDFI